MRRFAIFPSIIGFAIDADEVLFHQQQFVFGCQKGPCLYRDLYIVIGELHEIGSKILYRHGIQLGLADALVEGGEGKGGDIGADGLVRNLREIVFFASVVRIIQVLGGAMKAARDLQAGEQKGKKTGCAHALFYFSAYS